MKLDYSENGVIKVNKVDYVNAMVNDFPEAIPKSYYPWNKNLFKVDTKSPALCKEKKEIFHTFVAIGLFLCKRARPDIQPVIAFLETRVQGPNEQDWNKLIKMLAYLNNTRNNVLVFLKSTILILSNVISMQHLQYIMKRKAIQEHVCLLAVVLSTLHQQKRKLIQVVQRKQN
jgi:hypothetical protein